MKRLTYELETPLQRNCETKDLTRDLTDVSILLDDLGIGIERIIREQLEKRYPTEAEPFTVVDLFCGSGASIEEIAQRLLNDEWVPYGLFRTIGIDQLPLPQLMPSDIQECTAYIRDEYCIDGEHLAKFILHDLNHGIPLESESVDVCYGVEGAIYITDVLMLLSDMHRTLRANGFGILRIAPWFVAEPRKVSKDRRSIWRLSEVMEEFLKMLEETPGAGETFEVIRMKNRKLGGGIVCRKKPEIQFKGFPYEVEREFTGSELSVSEEPLIKHCRSAVYRRLQL